MKVSVATMIGLLDTDGHTDTYYFSFVNSNLNLVKTFLNISSILHFSPKKWKFYLQIPIGQNPEKLKKQWSEYLKCHEQQLKVYFNKYSKKVTCSAVLCDSKIVKKISKLRNTINTKIKESNKKISIFYLKGVFAGDGYYSGHRIKIAFDKNFERKLAKLYVKAFFSLGIKAKIEKDTRVGIVTVGRLPDLWYSDYLGIFDLYQERRQKVLDYLTNVTISFVISKQSWLDFLDSVHLSRAKIGKLIGRDRRTVSRWTRSDGGLGPEDLRKLINNFPLFSMNLIPNITAIKTHGNTYTKKDLNNQWINFVNWCLKTRNVL